MRTKFFEIRRLADHQADIRISSLRNKKGSAVWQRVFLQSFVNKFKSGIFVVNDETTKSFFGM